MVCSLALDLIRMRNAPRPTSKRSEWKQKLDRRRLRSDWPSGCNWSTSNKNDVLAGRLRGPDGSSTLNERRRKQGDFSSTAMMAGEKKWIQTIVGMLNESSPLKRRRTNAFESICLGKILDEVVFTSRPALTEY
jgi:hypothetical protein